MTVAICVPFRARNEHETRVWAWCEARWRALFPDWQICVADSGHQPFNRSASRNLAAAPCGDYEPSSTIVFANSDTVPLNREDVLTAVDICEAGGWVLPSRYFEVTEGYTSAALESDPGGVLVDPWESYDRQLEASPAGPQIMPRGAFERIGGWDEAFKFWAYEDAAARDALDVLWRPHTKVGVSVHLFHERTRAETVRDPDVLRNRSRYQKLYKRAAVQRTEAARRTWMERAIVDHATSQT